MIKKLVSIAGASALLLSVAVPAFASPNVAIIKDNDTTAEANTGLNTQDNLGGNYVVAGKGSGNSASVDSSGSRNMTTGNAKAKAKSVIVANVNVGCGCEDPHNGGDPFAKVKDNDTTASANSGINAQDNVEQNTVKAGKGSGNSASVDESGSRTMNTGNAKAKAKSWIVVNSNVNFGF